MSLRHLPDGRLGTMYRELEGFVSHNVPDKVPDQRFLLICVEFIGQGHLELPIDGTIFTLMGIGLAPERFRFACPTGQIAATGGDKIRSHLALAMLSGTCDVS